MIQRPVWKWDKWQQEAIDYEGSITLRCGRQSGKSKCMSKRRANQMIKYNPCVSLVIAPAQRQSGELFIKVMGWLNELNQDQLDKAGGYTDDPKISNKQNLEERRRFEYDNGIFNENPTKTTIILKLDFDKPRSPLNQGSICYSLPAGKTGDFLRCYALDFLDIDEAAYVPMPVYVAVKPMLAISEKTRGLGWESLMSTPFGKGGFFHASHFSEDYKKIHISSENCPRISKSTLQKAKRTLSKAQYRQEWLGEFCDEWNQFFPTDLIKKQMSFIEWSLNNKSPTARYYLGVDIARYGGDQNAFVICEMEDKKLRIVKCFTTDRVSTTDTIGRIQKFDEIYNFNKIFIDDGGLGGSVLDVLTEKMGRKIMGLNNASKRIEVQGEEKKKGILKEDLYSNALMLLETGKLELINDIDLLRSLKSVTFEYTSNRNLKIFGDFTHLTEALVRSVWCIKERGLSLYCM